ncbi:MAG: helix-turn-helix domain-containing protein [Prevotella sp.]|nr:helix-turn-helix domain-containing protein [Prevotella sp.]
MAKNSFTAEIVKQLALRGMTQKQLAEAIGYGYSSVRSFISGCSGNENIAQAIADYLKIRR